MALANQHIIDVLNEHKNSYDRAKDFASQTKQPVPTHTVNWSQILISKVTGIMGIDRKKGPDLADGSDVKGASTWGAIDTPRFNGVVPAGRILNDYVNNHKLYKNIYFVLWDYKVLNDSSERERCRIWCVAPNDDELFKEIVFEWYDQVKTGKIKSTNFQLHPPRSKNSNVFKNNCGALNYPLMMEAIFDTAINGYRLSYLDLDIPSIGRCTRS